MTLLMPRPLMLPVAASLLLYRPEWRIPFALAFVGHAGAVLATGWADEWLTMLASSTTETDSGLNLGPSRFIGLWWIALAFPAAAWLTWRGRLGWASLLAAPYWLPYYLLLPLLEVDRRAWLVRRDMSSRRDTLADAFSARLRAGVARLRY